MKSEICIFWHRRDLRIEDNAGLHAALTSGFPVQPIFIFDKSILDKLESKRDARVLFIHKELKRLKAEYAEHGCDLKVLFGKPIDIWMELENTHAIAQVHTNRDYEPYAQKRDKELHDFLVSKGIAFKGSKDHVIFEKGEVLKDDGTPYMVFTPYSKKWKAKLDEYQTKAYPTKKYLDKLHPSQVSALMSLEEIGFEDFEFPYFPPASFNKKAIKEYDQWRDFPAKNGTSKLSVHLRFGTVSIRQATAIALKTNEKWLNELIWRDFYQMILFFHPKSVDSAIRPDYDHIPWINNEDHFEAWCEGKTGYPIVDAGMRELNETGFMHNRVRMVVASFLTKHLLIDWRWGERYFASKLLDFELASNVGGWQWAASSGVDAAPYFRVFNPYTQAERFDKDSIYIRKWVPEVNSSAYPKAIVEHKEARQRAIDTVKQTLQQLR